MGTAFQLGMMKKFWTWMVLIIAKQCEVVNVTELST